MRKPTKVAYVMVLENFPAPEVETVKRDAHCRIYVEMVSHGNVWPYG
jgi:hypothetical protein